MKMPGKEYVDVFMEVTFIYDGKKPNIIFRKHIQNLFMSYYQLWVEMFDPNIKELNDNYTGPYDFYLDDGETINLNSEYTKYINTSCQPMIDKLNAIIDKRFFKKLYLGEYSDLRAELRNSAKLSFEAEIKEIVDK